MRNLLYRSLLLLILTECILVLGGCGGEFTQKGPSPKMIKELIQNDIDKVAKRVSYIEERLGVVKGQEAASLATDAFSLKNKLQGITDTLDDDVKSGYITEEEKVSYTQSITELKAKLDSDIPNLINQSGEFASTIQQDLITLPNYTKDDLETLITDYNRFLKDSDMVFPEEVTAEKLNTIKSVMNNKLSIIDKTINDLDKMVASGAITAEEKTTYLEELTKLRSEYENFINSLNSETQPQ